MKLHALLAVFTLAAVTDSSAAAHGAAITMMRPPPAFAAPVASVDSIFRKTPADWLLMVRRMNCSISAASPVIEAVLNIATTSGGSPIQRFLTLPFGPVQLNGSTNYYNFESDIHWLAGQSRFPFVQLAANGALSGAISCTLTGNLVTPMQ